MSSPEGDIMDMDDVFGISVHNSMENPETFSPTRISTVLFFDPFVSIGIVMTLPLPNLIENYGSLANHIAVIGTGNEADQRHHYANTLTNGSKNKTEKYKFGSGFFYEDTVIDRYLCTLKEKIKLCA